MNDVLYSSKNSVFPLGSAEYNGLEGESRKSSGLIPPSLGAGAGYGESMCIVLDTAVSVVFVGDIPSVNVLASSESLSEPSEVGNRGMTCACRDREGLRGDGRYFGVERLDRSASSYEGGEEGAVTEGVGAGAGAGVGVGAGMGAGVGA
jgi:hypothetical protein